MLDFADLRRRMVDNQIRTADVTYRPVLAAIENLPRERFLPEAAKPFAYSDQHLMVGRVETTGESRYSLAPVLFARMVQAVEPVQGERVLHIACGTGYGSAVFAKLGAHVVALDEDASLIAAAERALAEAGISGVKTRVGMLFEGASSEAPFDVIFIEGAYEREPEALVAQLADGGRLLGVSGVGRAAQVMLQVKTGDALTGRAVFDASAPLLRSFTRRPEFAF
ncbi:MAG TPA: protein-L-isoaspartate O-methyltransferase [Beijerinckiaceae bacterium]|jgi:protein-L-isoaspartate(D-aspartate) O-methyltransferase|nr:protein-L-isoaspartate O-methyltransferase [Beijerinckiaceae bacterium]